MSIIVNEILAASKDAVGFNTIPNAKAGLVSVTERITGTGKKRIDFVCNDKVGIMNGIKANTVSLPLTSAMEMLAANGFLMCEEKVVTAATYALLTKEGDDNKKKDAIIELVKPNAMFEFHVAANGTPTLVKAMSAAPIIETPAEKKKPAK